MKKSKIIKRLAKGITSTLNATLRVEANSASCAIIYQPKAPKKIIKI